MKNFVALFVDNFVTGLPAAAITLIPDHLRQQVIARCGDFLPFGNISANADLLRAARLSWIEATNVIRGAVKEQVGDGPRRDPLVLEFDDWLKPKLIKIRSEAFNRDVLPSPSPIDVDLQAILDGAAEFISPSDHGGIGDRLNSRFEIVLAELTNWDQVPEIFGRTAHNGIVIAGTSVARSFGELVFASFAELIKDPDRYCQAREAFHVSMQKHTLDLGKQNQAELQRMRQSFLEGMQELRGDLAHSTVCALENFDPRMTAAIDQLDAAAVLQHGLERYLQQQSIQLQRMEQKIDDLVARTAQAEGVPLAMLNAVRLEMGEDTLALSIPELGQRLVEMARNYRRLTDQLNYLSNDDPAVVALRHAASGLIEAGRFAEADAKLAEAEARDLVGLNEVERISRQKRLSAAATRAARGDAAVILGGLNSYRQAALHFAEARTIARSVSTELAHRYGIFQGQCLLTIGSTFGRNEELREAIDHFNAMLADTTDRAERADTLSELGRAYLTLGRRKTGSNHFQKAVAAFQDAIREHRAAKGVDDWADTHLQLGHALRALALRERKPEMLGDSLEAYRNFLRTGQGQTSEEQALIWTNIGHTMLIGGRRLGEDWNREAVEAYREALKLMTIENAPLRYASALTNLGKALLDLGDEADGLRHLEQSVLVHRQVLTAEIRRRYPFDWAVTQNNLGALLRFLAQREGNDVRLRDAVDAHQLALNLLTPDRSPVESATTKVALGNVLVDLGERSDEPTHFRDAISSYELALDVFKGRLPYDWAGTRSNMGYAFRSYAQYHLRRNEAAAAAPLLLQAVTAYSDTIAAYTAQEAVDSRRKAEDELTKCSLLLSETQFAVAKLAFPLH